MGERDTDAAHIVSIKNRNHPDPSFGKANHANKKYIKKPIGVPTGGGGSGGGGGGGNDKKLAGVRQETTILMVPDKERRKNAARMAATQRKESAGSGRSSCSKCCRKFATFMFSHVGLSCLVVGYSIMGGFLFQWLESEGDTLERANIKKERDKFVQQLWNMTERFNILHETNWTVEAVKIMVQFQDEVYKAVKERGWDGREQLSPEQTWSFPNSLLYSVTVITTIGYGHIAPKTSLGKLVTMFYALLGIPLTLLFLANIGSFFANCFRFLYKHLCNGLVWCCCPSHFQNASSSSSGNPKKSPPEKSKGKKIGK